MSEPTRDDRGRAATKAINRTILEIMDSPADVVVDRLDTCLSELLKNADGWERTELMRRIAETKLSILSERRDSEVFLNVWEEMERLGYSNAEREASMLFYFLKVCARNKQVDDACTSALDRLERLTKLVPEISRAHFEGVHDRLRKKLSRTDVSE